jgi:hypothetical protein
VKLRRWSFGTPLELQLRCLGFPGIKHRITLWQKHCVFNIRRILFLILVFEAGKAKEGDEYGQMDRWSQGELPQRQKNSQFIQDLLLPLQRLHVLELIPELNKENKGRAKACTSFKHALYSVSSLNIEASLSLCIFTTSSKSEKNTSGAARSKPGS